MPSNIIATNPIAGNPTTQSVRDNFAIAKQEISDLQSIAGKGVTVAPVDWEVPIHPNVEVGQIVVRPGRNPSGSFTAVEPGAWLGFPGTTFGGTSSFTTTPRYRQIALDVVGGRVQQNSFSFTTYPQPDRNPAPAEIVVLAPRSTGSATPAQGAFVWCGVPEEFVLGAPGVASSPTPPRYVRLYPGPVVTETQTGQFWYYTPGVGPNEIRFVADGVTDPGRPIVTEMWTGNPVGSASPSTPPTRLLRMGPNAAVGTGVELRNTFMDWDNNAVPPGYVAGSNPTDNAIFGPRNLMQGSRSIYARNILIGTENRMGITAGGPANAMPRNYHDVTVIGGYNWLSGYATVYNKLLVFGGSNTLGNVEFPMPSPPDAFQRSIFMGWDNKLEDSYEDTYLIGNADGGELPASARVIGIGGALDTNGNTTLADAVTIGHGAKFYPAGAHIGGDNTTTISYGPGTGTAFTNRSDARLKDNIVAADVERCLADINRLPVKRFSYKSFVRSGRDRTVTGFRADEFARVFPKSVVRDRYQKGNHVIEDCLSTDTSQLVPTLVAAVQALSAQVAALKARPGDR
jgi:hypothetical protein